MILRYKMLLITVILTLPSKRFLKHLTREKIVLYFPISTAGVAALEGYNMRIAFPLSTLP